MAQFYDVVTHPILRPLLVRLGVVQLLGQREETINVLDPVAIFIDQMLALFADPLQLRLQVEQSLVQTAQGIAVLKTVATK